MYYLYPTVSTDSACTRVSAVTYALICPYPDWLYRLRAVAVSRHLVLERESSLIFCKSNPITHPCPALLLSLSLSLSFWSSTAITGCPLFEGNLHSPCTSLVTALILPRAFSAPGVSLSRSETTLFIHSADRTRVACVAKNRTPRAKGRFATALAVHRDRASRVKFRLCVAPFSKIRLI